MLKASLTCFALAVAFFAGVRPAEAAIVGGAFLLLTRSRKPARIYRELDGPLLILFAGLFVVVAGAERYTARRRTSSPRCRRSASPIRGGCRRWSPYCPTSSATCRRCWALKPFIPPLADVAPRLASRRDEFDARWQFHPDRFGRQPHCRRAGERSGFANQLFRLFQGRPAADPGHARFRNRLCGLGSSSRSGRNRGGAARWDKAQGARPWPLSSAAFSSP